jgi:cell shape-determining protein MreC
VARVESIDRETGQVFARIVVRPLAGADRSAHLLVLGEAAAQPPRPDEPASPDAAKKGGRGKGQRGG